MTNDGNRASEAYNVGVQHGRLQSDVEHGAAEIEWGICYSRSLRNDYPAPDEATAREWAKADGAYLIRRVVRRTPWATTDDEPKGDERG